jgi:beta-barrel assembly-enhancing protease
MKIKLIIFLILIGGLKAVAITEFKLEAHKSPETEIQRIFKMFIQSLGKDTSDYKIFISDSKQLNAHAGLNKQVTLTSRLVEEIHSESAMAFVIAHELGHVEKKHVVKGITRSILGSGLNIAVSVLTKSSALGDLSQGVEGLQRKAYSRSHEKDADVFAMNLVNRFYCNVPGKLEFFEKIVNKKNGLWNISYFSTHPMTETRISYLKAMIYRSGCVV